MATTTTTAPRQTRGRTKHRCWLGWQRRLCRGRWRWDPTGALAFVAWATRLRRAKHTRTEAVTRGANGFDLHAGLVVPAGQRERLERVCRYALRPPVTPDRLRLTHEGQVRLELRRPWRDGRTDLVFDPVEFLGRLAVLVPRPRINLILYHGVLGPRAAWRADVIRRTASEDGGDAGLKEPTTSEAGGG